MWFTKCSGSMGRLSSSEKNIRASWSSCAQTYSQRANRKYRHRNWIVSTQNKRTTTNLKMYLYKYIYSDVFHRLSNWVVPGLVWSEAFLMPQRVTMSVDWWTRAVFALSRSLALEISFVTCTESLVIGFIHVEWIELNETK